MGSNMSNILDQITRDDFSPSGTTGAEEETRHPNEVASSSEAARPEQVASSSSATSSSVNPGVSRSKRTRDRRGETETRSPKPTKHESVSSSETYPYATVSSSSVPFPDAVVSTSSDRMHPETVGSSFLKTVTDGNKPSSSHNTDEAKSLSLVARTHREMASSSHLGLASAPATARRARRGVVAIKSSTPKKKKSTLPDVLSTRHSYDDKGWFPSGKIRQWTPPKHNEYDLTEEEYRGYSKQYNLHLYNRALYSFREYNSGFWKKNRKFHWRVGEAIKFTDHYIWLLARDGQVHKKLMDNCLLFVDNDGHVILLANYNYERRSI